MCGEPLKLRSTSNSKTNFVEKLFACGKVNVWLFLFALLNTNQSKFPSSMITMAAFKVYLISSTERGNVKEREIELELVLPFAQKK